MQNAWALRGETAMKLLGILNKLRQEVHYYRVLGDARKFQSFISYNKALFNYQEAHRLDSFQSFISYNKPAEFEEELFDKPAFQSFIKLQQATVMRIFPKSPRTQFQSFISYDKPS